MSKAHEPCGFPAPFGCCHFFAAVLLRQFCLTAGCGHPSVPLRKSCGRAIYFLLPLSRRNDKRRCASSPLPLNVKSYMPLTFSPRARLSDSLPPRLFWTTAKKKQDGRLFFLLLISAGIRPFLRCGSFRWRRKKKDGRAFFFNLISAGIRPFLRCGSFRWQRKKKDGRAFFFNLISAGIRPFLRCEYSAERQKKPTDVFLFATISAGVRPFLRCVCFSVRRMKQDGRLFFLLLISAGVRPPF